MDKSKKYESLLKALTGKQAQFVRAYLSTLNATKAAEMAKYKGSYGTLRSIGSENLTKPNIKAAIDAGLEAHGKISKNELLSRLSRIAAGDMSPYLYEREVQRVSQKGDVYTTPVMWFDLDKFRADGLGFLIKKIKNVGGGLDIEFHDPVRAQELLGKHYKLFTENIKFTEPVKVVWDLLGPTEDVPADE